jgi:hypothetical protein
MLQKRFLRKKYLDFEARPSGVVDLIADLHEQRILVA